MTPSEFRDREWQNMQQECVQRSRRMIPRGLERGLLAALVLLTSAIAPAAARAAAPRWKFTRPIETPPLEKEELVSVRMDGAIFSESRSDMGDLRVLDAEDAIVPFFFRTPQETRSREYQKTWPTKLTGKPLPGGGLELLVSLRDNDPLPEGVLLSTPLKDFEQRVQVETSADGMDWVPNGEHLIFDYSKHLNVRHLSVPIRTEGHRHFRLTIDHLTSEQESELLELTRRLRGNGFETEERVSIARRPFRIDRVSFWRNEVQKQATGSQLTKYPIQRFSVEQDLPLKRTLIFVDMLREPVSGFTVQTTATNFSRHTEVQSDAGTPESPDWMMVGEGTLARIDIPPLQRDETLIAFPPKPSSRWRIVIDNLDSPPLEITGVEAEGVIGETLFIAMPGKAYRLAYGSPKTEPPEFDTVAIRTRLEAGVVPLAATLGAPVMREGGGAAEPISLVELFNNPLVAGPVILLLMAILGWGLYRAMREVDTLPPQQGP